MAPLYPGSQMEAGHLPFS